MSVHSWMLFWKIVLIAGIGLFAALAVMVSIGGFFDIRRLFQMLREQRGKE
jgi:hypothetical protein